MTFPPVSYKSIRWEFPLFLLPPGKPCICPLFSSSFVLSKATLPPLLTISMVPLFLENSASPPGDSDGRESACNAGDPGSLGQEDPLEKGTATHSSILAWRISWIEEPSGLHPWGHKSWTWLSDFHFLTRIFIQPMPNPITVHKRNFLLILLSRHPLLSLLFHNETSRNELPKCIVSISLHLSLLCCFRISASPKITNDLLATVIWS